MEEVGRGTSASKGKEVATGGSQSKNAEYEEKTHELAIQEELAKEISKPSGEISLKTKNHLERLKSHYKAVQKGQWLGKHPTGEDVFLRLLTKRRGFAKTTGKNAREQIKPTSSKSPLERLKSNQETLQRDHWLGKNLTEFVKLLRKRRGFAKTTGKLSGEQVKPTSHTMGEEIGKPQQVSSLNRLHRAPGHSLQKRSILHLPTELPPLTSSIVVEDSDKDWAGKVVFVLKSTNRSARPSHVKHIIITEQAKKENTPSEQNTEKVIKKPSDETAKQGIPQYGKVYIIYLLLAFSVTTFIMIIIILIILLIKVS